MTTGLDSSSDTELAVIPSGLLNYIKWRHPRVVSHLINVLSQKIYGTMQNTLTSSVGLTMPLADGRYTAENERDEWGSFFVQMNFKIKQQR